MPRRWPCLGGEWRFGQPYQGDQRHEHPTQHVEVIHRRHHVGLAVEHTFKPCIGLTAGAAQRAHEQLKCPPAYPKNKARRPTTKTESSDLGFYTLPRYCPRHFSK